MFDPDPPRPPWLVWVVLGTGRLPVELVEDLYFRFQAVREDVGPLLIEKRYNWGLHYFLSDLASRVDPVPGFEQLDLLEVYQDGTVHLLYSLFSLPIDLYSTAWRLFA